MEAQLTVIEGDRDALRATAMGHLVRWICDEDEAALARARALDACLARRGTLAVVAAAEPPVTRG